jgi:hypothetical protein
VKKNLADYYAMISHDDHQIGRILDALQKSGKSKNTIIVFASGAGARLCSHIWEHYSFIGDKDFLKRMYPVMKGSVEFYLGWLVENPKTGKLVSGTAVSPENTFVAPDGSHSQICMEPAHDQQVIWQLFTDFIAVSEVLELKDDMVEKVAAKKKIAGLSYRKRRGTHRMERRMADKPVCTVVRSRQSIREPEHRFVAKCCHEPFRITSAFPD